MAVKLAKNEGNGNGAKIAKLWWLKGRKQSCISCISGRSLIYYRLHQPFRRVKQRKKRRAI